MSVIVLNPFLHGFLKPVNCLTFCRELNLEHLVFILKLLDFGLEVLYRFYYVVFDGFSRLVVSGVGFGRLWCMARALGTPVFTRCEFAFLV